MAFNHSMLKRCSIVDLYNINLNDERIALLVCRTLDFSYTLICLVLAVQAILLESNCKLVIGPSYEYISKIDPVRRSHICTELLRLLVFRAKKDQGVYYCE